MCPEIRIENVSQETYNRLITELSKNGIQAKEGDELVFDHCHFIWKYENQTLSITCTKKPFFISCDHINNKLLELFRIAEEGGGNERS